ncbi:MAG TPA: polysaccharide deacetylase family protein [Holophagaceae bacterium]|nr:polysaccharide deacetylase family protein [Holophagaceae bacterium]
MSRRLLASAVLAPGLLALAALGTTLACDRSSGSSASAPSSAQPVPQAQPWTWHRIGDYMVIEGEVDRPTHLRLSGPSTDLRTAVDFGPVRWEFRSPLAGEPVTLEDEEGRRLAAWVLKGDGSEEAPAPLAAPAPAPRVAALAKAAPATARPEPRTRDQVPARKPLPAPSPALPPAVPQIPPPALPARALDGTWPGAGAAVNLTRGPRDRKVILLSFDGGSSDEAADEILTTLERRHIRTTIFLTGAFIERFPDVVRRIVADGHEVGNHTFDHPHFAPDFRRDPSWTEARVQDELLRADAAFYRLTGRPMDPFWRSPYGENTKEIRAWAEAIGYRHVGWSEGADSLDWATPKERRLYRSGDAILEKLHARMEKDGDGLIVLMHLGSDRPEADRPAAKLGAFIDRAQAEGWRFVTASEMLRLTGQPDWNRDRRLALLRLTAAAGGR